MYEMSTSPIIELTFNFGKKVVKLKVSYANFQPFFKATYIVAPTDNKTQMVRLEFDVTGCLLLFGV